MKTLTVIGARPQFIKVAVVSRAISQHNEACKNDRLVEIIVHTGQHYDANMSDIFFKEMQIPMPDYHLGIESTSHGAMTGRMMEGIEEVIIKEKPDALLVYGDTNSTIAGALAAVKLHVPVAHVEAGLRSFNMLMPEEINRIVTDRISHWLFCPTETAVLNLKKEGIEKGVQIVGDVMYDAMLHYKKIAGPTKEIEELINKLNGNYSLATVHRAENTDDPKRLSSIIGALEELSEGTQVILPLHPRTRKMFARHGISAEKIRVIEPVGYFDMIHLLDGCKYVLTDSGGLQKEAYFFHKPCITLRDETEWVELIQGGYNTLAGADRDNIIMAAKNVDKAKLDFSTALYGRGNAGDEIVKLLLTGMK